MSRSGVGEPSQRQLRVAMQIKGLVANMLLEEMNFFNPKVQLTLVTVTEVRISPDLKNATVFVAISKSMDPKTVIKSLAKMVYLLKKRIADSLNLRYVPRIKFLHDDTLGEAEKIDKLLSHEKVQKDLKKDTE